ncbi:hypothetical protein UFOVP119_22 [uncultured Caudovirales phage]|uniref:Helix-turn-helix domain containing protein n=1 Tax=uncultured Caudovirales phage TaxID=2100421 RepID=A0A6J5L706_9CAUD|nr:hypothetical protein UFOVP119_22 [uncultured Caudovirales phage]
MGYSKLFDTMWSGSLYGKFEASAVFMVLLSVCDQHGHVDMTPEAIAGKTGWPLEFINTGITELEKPDKRSRTPAAEGRRIQLLDGHRNWGWSITNYQKYRDLQRSVQRREYLTEAKRKERAAKREAQAPQQNSTTVNKSTIVNRCQPITDADADADAEGRDKPKNTTTLALEPSPAAPAASAPDPMAGFSEWYALYPRKRSRADAAKAWPKVCTKAGGPLVLIEALKRQLPSLIADMARDGGRYVPYPASWLNADQWADEIALDPNGMPPGAKPHALGWQMPDGKIVLNARNRSPSAAGG